VKDLRRGYVRRAPGRLVRSTWDPQELKLVGEGRGAKRNQGRLEVFVPSDKVRFSPRGLRAFKGVPLGKSTLLTFRPKGGKWTLRATVNQGR